MKKTMIRLQIAACLMSIVCGPALSQPPDPGAMEHDGDPLFFDMPSLAKPAENLQPDLGSLPVVKDHMFEAVQNDDVNFLLILLKSGHDVNRREKEKERTPLMEALSWAMAATLIKYGANLDARDSDGRTPLHHAVSAPQAILICELLVEKGADVNARDNQGYTPLAASVITGKTELVKSLLQLGANPSLATVSGETPLDIAYSLGHRFIVQLLE